MHLAQRKSPSVHGGRPPLVPHRTSSKPTGKAPAPNYRRYALASLLSFLFIVLWFHEPVSISSAQVQDACAPHPLVCAQNVAGPDLNARTGSIDLFSELWKSGIRCIGLSVTPLKDTLVAREASRIQTVTDSLRSNLPLDEQALPFTPTHEQLLEWASLHGIFATEDFPTLERALKWFQETVIASGGIRHSETRPLQRWFGQSDKTSPLDTTAPLLLITIEGDNVRTAHYSTAAALVSSLGLSHHVGVIVPDGAAHRDAFAGALASASPEIYRGLSVPPEANVDAQRSRKLASTLYDFLAPNAETPEAMLAAARVPGNWKPTVATGLVSESAFNTTLKYQFPVMMSSHALRFHRDVLARSDACKRDQETNGHISDTRTQHYAVIDRLNPMRGKGSFHTDMHVQSGVSGQGGAGGAQMNTGGDTITHVIHDSGYITSETVTAGVSEPESAEAGGVGDHDLEQNAQNALRMERVAAAAAAALKVTSQVHTNADIQADSDPDRLTSGSTNVAGTVSTGALMHEQHASAVSGDMATGQGSGIVENISSLRTGFAEQGTVIGVDMGDDSIIDNGANMVKMRVVTLPEDEQPRVEVEGGVVKNATHELVSADTDTGDIGISDPALEAQAGTAAPVLRARTHSQGTDVSVSDAHIRGVV